MYTIHTKTHTHIYSHVHDCVNSQMGSFDSGKRQGCDLIDYPEKRLHIKVEPPK